MVKFETRRDPRLKSEAETLTSFSNPSPKRGASKILARDGVITSLFASCSWCFILSLDKSEPAGFVLKLLTELDTQFLLSKPKCFAVAIAILSRFHD